VDGDGNVSREELLNYYLGAEDLTSTGDFSDQDHAAHLERELVKLQAAADAGVNLGGQFAFSAAASFETLHPRAEPEEAEADPWDQTSMSPTSAAVRGLGTDPNSLASASTAATSAAVARAHEQAVDAAVPLAHWGMGGSGGFTVTQERLDKLDVPTRVVDLKVSGGSVVAGLRGGSEGVRSVRPMLTPVLSSPSRD
jgi:hypothetical protein